MKRPLPSRATLHRRVRVASSNDTTATPDASVSTGVGRIMSPSSRTMPTLVAKGEVVIRPVTLIVLLGPPLKSITMSPKKANTTAGQTQQTQRKESTDPTDATERIPLLYRLYQDKTTSVLVWQDRESGAQVYSCTVYTVWAVAYIIYIIYK